MATAATIDVLLTANTARYRAAMVDAGRVTNQQLGGIRKEAAATAQSIQTLNRVAGGFIGFQGLKTAAVELSRVADQYSNVQAKIRLAAGENANLAGSFDKVFGVAQRTFNTLDGTAALVQRGSQALRSFGQDAETAFGNSVALAELFNKGLVVSGASASEAAAAAQQFSQALASGKFQGDEFRSVLENNSRFASLLAKSLGVNIAELRDMSKEGKLTTQTFLNLLGQTAELDAEFSRMPLTIGRAKTLLDNAFTKFIGEGDQARGVSRSVAAGIQALANNLGPVVSALANLGIVAAGAFAGRGLLALKAYTAGILEQAAAAKALQAVTVQKAASDAAAAQQALLRARGDQIAAESAAAAAAVDRQRIQSAIAMSLAQESVIRANALRATSEIELALLSERLTALEGARAAATAALGVATQAGVRANAALLVSNRALQSAYVATGATGAEAASKINIGMRAASVAQGAMTLATRAFTGALALVGGPLGVVIIGVGLLANAFANSKVKADEAAQSYRSAIDAANAFRDFQSRETALQAGSQLLADRAAAQAELERRRALRAQSGVAYFDAGRNGTALRSGSGLDEQIRLGENQVKELTRQLDYVNKQIMANHEAWQANGSAVESATNKYEKQNAALDKEAQQLTAQRLELTRGIKARLEYEAMQEQGVKTAAELDAGTKSRIEVLAREHAALKAATDGRKASTKANRESVAEAKQQENQYNSIIDRINQQIALDKEAMLVNDDMTAAQKLQVIVTNQLESAKNKLSETEQTRVRALLDEAVAQGLAQKSMEDAKKGAEDMLRLQNQLAEASRSQRDSNTADLMGIGRGGDAVEQMRRLVDLQREYQRQVESLNEQMAAAGGDKATEGAKESYRNQLEALRKFHEQALADEEQYQDMRAEMMADGLNGVRAALEDYIAEAQDIAGQSKEIMGSVLGGLEDVFVDFFSKGTADWKGFLDDINAQILRFIVKQQLSKLAEKFLPGLAGGGDQASALSGAAGQLAASAGPLLGAAAALSASAAALAAAGLASAAGGAGGGAASGGGTNWASWISMGLGALGYDSGGYTGPGGRKQPAGVVHKGEVVWSQMDVARSGGVAAVEAMRRGLRGYADGGWPGGASMVRLGRRPEDSEMPNDRGNGRRPVSVVQQFYNPVFSDRASESQRQQEAGRKLRVATRNS